MCASTRVLQLSQLGALVGPLVDVLFVGCVPHNSLLFLWDLCILSSFDLGCAVACAAILTCCRLDMLRCTTVGVFTPPPVGTSHRKWESAGALTPAHKHART